MDFKRWINLYSVAAALVIFMGPRPAMAAMDEDLPTSSSAVHPLKTGDKAPAVKVKTPEGETISLTDVLSSAPTVLIFYRGGWCPYCNAQLGKLSMVQDDLTSAGYQIVAISPDTPEYLKETMDKDQVNYLLLSDTSSAASRAFGLAFRVDDETVDKYKEHNIDLEKRSGGETGHILPVPAAYVIDKKGEIRFAHWNADYKSRIDEKKLLKAALDAR